MCSSYRKRRKTKEKHNKVLCICTAEQIVACSQEANICITEDSVLGHSSRCVSQGLPYAWARGCRAQNRQKRSRGHDCIGNLKHEGVAVTMVLIYLYLFGMAVSPGIDIYASHVDEIKMINM